MIDNYAKVVLKNPIARQRTVIPKKVSIRQKRTAVVSVRSGSSLQPMADIYEGEYDVTPSFNAQTLATKGLAMREDVTVHPIGVSITENLSGGNTVYIGPF